MKPKLFFCLALVLSGGLLGCSTVKQPDVAKSGRGNTAAYLREHEDHGSSAGSALFSLPVLLPALMALHQGDKATAVGDFLSANWVAHPLFVPGSVLSLSEQQLHALSKSEYKSTSKEIDIQLGELNELLAAVMQAGYEADFRKGDNDKMFKCFIAVDQFGAALDNPDYSPGVRLVGQTFKAKSGSIRAALTN